jgi:hypothetical protein
MVELCCPHGAGTDWVPLVRIFMEQKSSLTLNTDPKWSQVQISLWRPQPFEFSS